MTLVIKDQSEVAIVFLIRLKVKCEISSGDGAKAVVKLLQNKISDGEFSDIISSLPDKLRDIITDRSVE